MSGWEEVYDRQIELYRWWRTPTGVRYLDRFVADREKKGRSIPELHDETVAEVWEALTVALFRADPFYVSDEMMDLLEAAAETFQLEPLLPTDLITPYGFVLFPRAIHLRDAQDKRIAFRAVSWMPISWSGNDVALDWDRWSDDAMFDLKEGRRGIMLGVYSHEDDEDEYTREYTQSFPGLPRRLPGAGPLELLHYMPWWFDVTYDKVPDDAIGTYTSLRDLQVFFRLSMQYVAQRNRMVPPRPQRRRAKREELPERYVTVIRLRRPRSKTEGEPREVEWSHRWLVGGHWRNQWYPSLHTHRQIYISDYVKGPEDKELRIRKGRAFELVR